MESIHAGLRELNITGSVELPRRAGGETHLVLSQGTDLVALCGWAAQRGYYLCTLAACDERMLEDNAFKLYAVLSGPTGRLVILEHPLERDTFHYLSLRAHFPAVEPLERIAQDQFGLAPHNVPAEAGFLLHSSFPPDLYPLRRNRTYQRLAGRIAAHGGSPASAIELPFGVFNLVVGPIHAGIIEAGQFRFYVAGEVIEDLDIRLGYKHRGIEKLFETSYTLTTGQELAERISGDSSFAHSLAYCHAVENLLILPLPPAVLCWRGLFLEMERLYNHIGDVAALVHDIAFDLIASELFVLREQVMRLNHQLTGSRLLRGANHPAGIDVRSPHHLPEVTTRVAEITGQFLDLVDKQVLANPTCRNRFIDTGVLTREEASHMGATGVPARAAGLWRQDFRLRHPTGIFDLSGLGTDLRGLLEDTFVDPDPSSLPSKSGRRIPVYRTDLTGDAFARLLVRVAEVETTAKLIERLGAELLAMGTEAPLSQRDALPARLRDVDNFEIGLGYVEGWRGDIFYFLMKGPGNTIFRCQPRDPSLYNWPALRLAVIRKPQVQGDTDKPAKRPVYRENILADFPVINKSFNLSYAGHDG
jgi:Ni,Fe-hydrogenase III large subunit/Ni,Fe-hydrogenase III component G